MQDYAHIDPIVIRSKHIVSPFLWTEALPFTRAQESSRGPTDVGEAFGFKLRAGFVVPILTLDGAFAAVSLAGERVDIPPTLSA